MTIDLEHPVSGNLEPFHRTRLHSHADFMIPVRFVPLRRETTAFIKRSTARAEWSLTSRPKEPPYKHPHARSRLTSGPEQLRCLTKTTCDSTLPHSRSWGTVFVVQKAP